jgi:hypothetical protein
MPDPRQAELDDTALNRSYYPMALLIDMAMFFAIFSGIVLLWAGMSYAVSRFEDWLRYWPGDSA